MLKNVSPGLIENVKDLKISLNELTVYDFDVYSSIEVYYKIAHKLNDIIRELTRFEGLVSDEVIKQNNKLLYLLGEGLENEVIKEIDNLREQNFFDDLVNVTLINKLNDRLDKVDSQLEQKANIYEVFKKENGININDFDEETRRVFLEAQGVDVNYTLGVNNVKLINLSNDIQNSISYFRECHLTLLNGYYGIGTASGNPLIFTENDSFNSVLIECTEGQRFKFSSNNNGGIYSVIFYDNNNFLINRSYKEKNIYEQIEIKVPENAKFMAINSLKDGLKLYSLCMIDGDYVYKTLKNPVISTNNLIDNSVTPEKVNFLIPKLKSNILDSSTYEKGKYVSGSGNLSDSETYGRFTQYIELDLTKTSICICTKHKIGGYINKIGTAGTDVYLYDGNKNYISYISKCNEFNLSDYPKAKYFRFNLAHTTYENYYIGVFYNEVPSVWEDYGKYYTFDEQIISGNNLTNNIYDYIIDCWGDSLTNGVGGNGNNYPGYLKALLGDKYTVNRYGNGGEGCAGISARQGGYDVYLKPFTLSSEGRTLVEFYENFNTKTRLTGNSGVNPCIVGGIKCNFYVEDKKYYLEPLSSVGNIEFDRPVKLNTFGSMNSKENINIIWSGTNNISSNGSTIEDISNAIESMVENLNHKKYIIIGLTSKYYHDDIEDKNKALGRKFGKHFLDIRNYILDFGLEDMNITATSDDLNAISNGEMPNSLLNDEVHFNAMGYELIARIVYKKGLDLGYWG